MIWGNSSIKQCELCNAEFQVRNIRLSSRLCGVCLPYKYEIDKVRADKKYSQMTDEDIQRVRSRIQRNGKTINSGFRFNIKEAESRVGR